MMMVIVVCGFRVCRARQLLRAKEGFEEGAECVESRHASREYGDPVNHRIERSNSMIAAGLRSMGGLGKSGQNFVLAPEP